jgi:2-C-methyl-D-erythritol 4-phosphate cytidylyltransferase
MHDDIDMILIVTNDTYIDDVKIWCKQYDLTKVKYIVAGGSSRQESVYNGLKKLEKIGISDEDIVLIHDAARPLISQTIITDNIEACKKYQAVDTVIPSSDTIIRSVDKETICEIQKRSEQYQGQTPQSFTFKVINDAHEYAKSINNTETTDDCRLVLNMGKDVHLVSGSKLNFKITTFDDLMMLKALLKIGKTGVM